MYSRNQRGEIFRVCPRQRRLQRTRRKKQVRKNASLREVRHWLYFAPGRPRAGLLSQYQGSDDFRAAKEFLATALRGFSMAGGKSSLLCNSAVASCCSNISLTRFSSARFCSVIGSPCRSFANTFLISSYAEAMTG